MRLTQLIGRTIKETPRDAELPSHRYLLRAGYTRQYSAGIYGLLPLAQRSMAKIEAICREEMNKVNGQEIKMPCMAPKEIWEESGRYSAIGKDMFRFLDRNEKPMVLNMTHEEPVVFLARTELTSYRQFPAMMYQIQTKSRDEPRPRGGLIRLREFIMKDAYSFHTSEEDLKNYYNQVHNAYNRFFKRTGCKNFVSVLSDNGMFGGKYSHEFMMLVPSGEDTLITCSHCSYKANREIASSPFVTKQTKVMPLEKIATPQISTIDALAEFLNIKPEDTCKAVMFQNKKEELIVAFIRGDLDVVEQKLTSLLQMELHPAKPDTIQKAGAVAGSTGPLGLNFKVCHVVIDKSVSSSESIITGANESDFHYKGLNLQRDLYSQSAEWQQKKITTGDIASVNAGDPCPECAQPLAETRGIEIGNIFHLGTRYSKAMNCTYLDQNGKSHNPTMGCYGIGITRLLPAIIEESHDDRGMILPIPIAPYHIHFCALNRKDAAIHDASEKLYADMLAAGIEVLFDDRDEKPGSQFADADLMGMPLRIVMSSKTLAEGKVEFKYRDNRSEIEHLSLDELIPKLKNLISQEIAQFQV